MNILAIETATEACSAAVYRSGEIYHRYQLAPRKHTRLILPMLDEVLKEAGLEQQAMDAIAFGQGPGAFTGLRIAMGIAQGLALALDKPLIGISTLAAMAQQMINDASEEGDILIPAIDARMNEVYWGRYQYQQGRVVLLGEEQVSAPEVLLAQNDCSIVVGGSGWDAYHPTLVESPPDWIRRVQVSVFPSAYAIAQLASAAYQRGEFLDAASAEPVYLRNNVAKKKGEQGKPG